MYPVTPSSMTSGTEPRARRSQECHRPSPRSSPVRTAPASRSGRAAHVHCRGSRLLGSPISPMNSTSGCSSSGAISCSKYSSIGPVDLRRDPQLHADVAGDLDRAVRPLLGRDAANESKIVAVAAAENGTGRPAIRDGRCQPVAVAAAGGAGGRRSTPAPVRESRVAEAQGRADPVGHAASSGCPAESREPAENEDSRRGSAARRTRRRDAVPDRAIM